LEKANNRRGLEGHLALRPQQGEIQPKQSLNTSQKMNTYEQKENQPCLMFFLLFSVVKSLPMELFKQKSLTFINNSLYKFVVIFVGPHLHHSMGRHRVLIQPRHWHKERFQLENGYLLDIWNHCHTLPSVKYSSS
jgi:hypothetical protein